MRLLIVSDAGGQIATASAMASRNGAKVSVVGDVASALNFVRDGKGADLVMIDVKFDIAYFINSISSERITIPVVACGTENDSASAVRAIKSGAKEYIPLPPNEELIAAVIQAITNEQQSIIGSSEKMRNILALCDQIAPSDASVLITGESGTGKEVIAKYIHKKSRRASNSMVSVNCAAIPDNLLESELFGHEKGAFTGALARRVGKFEEADNSTLLLDEISEMDPRLQAKLLRAIQEREIDRVGGTKPVKVNIRILATSNRDMQREIKDGKFREDLYFRLNVININLPPLRERKADIPVFAEHFIKKYADSNGFPAKPLSQAALDKLINYSWPGNVRELENTMHRAVLVAIGSEINANDIMIHGGGSEAQEDNANSAGFIGRTVESVERELILNTLDHCIGNRTQAANLLGISIRTLRNKLQEYEKEVVS